MSLTKSKILTTLDTILGYVIRMFFVIVSMVFLFCPFFGMFFSYLAIGRFTEKLETQYPNIKGFLEFSTMILSQVPFLLFMIYELGKTV